MIRPQIAPIIEGANTSYGDDTLMDDTTALFDDISSLMGVVIAESGKAQLAPIQEIKPILQTIL